MGLFRDVFAEYIFKDYSTNWFGERYISLCRGEASIAHKTIATVSS